jgi:hypothetical protein
VSGVRLHWGSSSYLPLSGNWDGYQEDNPEYKNKMATKVSVVMLYAGMLHRAPTTAELASGTGTALDTLANTIRLSTAYANRVG